MKKNRQISPERKALYYVGMAIGVIGLLLFFSVFFSAVTNRGNSGHFGNGRTIKIDGAEGFEDIEIHGVPESGPPTFIVRAFVGMGMVFLGGVLMTIGSKGVAGSGIILDPEKARRDVEPWSRARGGMIKDGLDEAGVNLEEIFGSKADGANAANFGEKLRELHRLYEEGILSKEEYEREKRETLDQI